MASGLVTREIGPLPSAFKGADNKFFTLTE